MVDHPSTYPSFTNLTFDAPTKHSAKRKDYAPTVAGGIEVKSSLNISERQLRGFDFARDDLALGALCLAHANHKSII